MNFTAKVHSGLPQGSPLSCTLFALYFDYMHPNSKIKSWFFADDTTFFIAGPSRVAIVSHITLLFNDFNCRCQENDQVLNEDKSQVLFIRRRSIKKDKYAYLVVDVLKSLAIWIDSQCRYNVQVSKLTLWTSRRIGILKHLRYKLSISPAVLIRIVQCWRTKAPTNQKGN